MSLVDRAVATFSHGFHRAYLLQEPGTDRGIAVIFWEDPGDMENNRTKAYDAIMAQMAPLFAHSPETNIYEVVEDIPSPPADKPTP